MTKLVTAKSRSAARTETQVAYRGDVGNPEWEGMAITVGGDGNGGSWGHIGAPTRYRALPIALSGGTTSVGVNGAVVSNFDSWSPASVVGGKLQVYRPVNGQMTLVREADVTGGNLSYWARLGSTAPITQTSFETRLPSFAQLTGTYTFGVAVIDAATGLIGPVSKINIDVTGPTHTTVTPATPTNNGVSRAVAGRNGALAAITGLTAEIKDATTHNIDLSWDASGPGTYVVFINWSDDADRLETECTLTINSGAAILTDDLLVYEGPLILALSTALYNRRIPGASQWASYIPTVVSGYGRNVEGGRSWQYVPYDGGFPKPDITYPDHYLQLNGTASLPALASSAFHAGSDQDFYSTLVPGRTYRAEIIAAASSPMNATFAVASATVSSTATVALTTTPQIFTFDFTRATILKTSIAQSWTFTGAVNNVSLRLLSVRVWDTAESYNSMMVDPPSGIDIRDHNFIKQFPAPSFDAITSRAGFGPNGWSLSALLGNCSAYSCNPHFQIEWLYDDQFYDDLTTFLFAPASSGEPLALKREALGHGPVHTSFARYLYEDGNERWNSIMWVMFSRAVDSATATVYNRGQLSAMFAHRRRAIMESNPYWPSSNPPIEFSGGWASDSAYTVAAANFPEAQYASIAAYTSGWDVNNVILEDRKFIWDSIMTHAQRVHLPRAVNIPAALVTAGLSVKVSIYEGGPGYQLSGLNGATLTTAQTVAQEAIAKSIGGTTSTMASIALFAVNGWGPYNFFTWASGSYWKAARPLAEGGGFYRVADYIRQIQILLGRCRVYQTSNFIYRSRVFEVTSNGSVTGTEQVPHGNIIHFESLDVPGRHGILYLNTKLNLEDFGEGHPDYEEGDTGEATFRYHTGLPSSATPFKVLSNEGNFRHHDAYKVGFRKKIVSGAIDGYEDDPLCVDLTVTPEDFTVTDPALRELTLLGGNCRMEIFDT